MSGTITIFRRELASLFLSPLAWILLLVALFVNGVFFIAFMSDSQGNVTSSLGLMLGGGYTFWAFLVFFPPLLTMRLLSEEARSGTLEYLLTAPVGDAAVVVGKFLAATSFMALLWASVLVYAFAVDRLGVTPDWGSVIGGYLGAVLASGLFIAIGMLASSLTATPLVAAFLAFIACLLWLILPSLAELLLIQVRSLLAHWAGGIDAAQAWIRAGLDKMNVLSHFQASFLPGVFDTGEVVFFLSWTALFVFLTTRILEARRWRI